MKVLKGILDSEYEFELSQPKEKTFHEYILRKVEDHVKNGRKEWLMDFRTGHVINFSDIEPITRKIASYFSRNGLLKGDTIIYTSHDCSLLYLVLLGIWRANGAIRSVYSEEKPETILESISESKSKWIICDPVTAVQLQLLESKNLENFNFKIVVMGDSREKFKGDVILVEELLKDDGESFPMGELGPNDIALTLPTSGTSGKSKGAATSHQALLFRIQFYEHHPLSNDLRNPPILFGKPTHSTGIALPYYHMAYGQFICTAPYTEDNLLRAAMEFDSLFCVSPLLLAFILRIEANPEIIPKLQVKHLFFGGAIANVGMIQKLKNLPTVETVVNILGMSETSMITSTAKFNSERKIQVWNDCPLGSIGKIGPWVQAQVRHLETGDILGPNERGEICFKTQAAFSYYLNNKEDTDKTLQNGWLITGDYGYYDQNGFLFILDRIKDTFLCHLGNHISPSDLEAVILNHPAVLDAIVIPYPFEQVGDPRGFVILKPGIKRYPGLSEEIKKFANSNLASYQHLHGGIFIVDSFPRGKSGKIIKRNLAHYGDNDYDKDINNNF